MSPIKAGDLVIVVRATQCCDYPEGIGKIFRVIRIVTTVGGHIWCPHCYGRFVSPDLAVSREGVDGIPLGFPVKYLRRIDPPAKEPISLPDRIEIT